MEMLHNQKGMTLLEVTLGIMVLAVGYLGLLPLMTNATASTLQSDLNMEATYMANEKMEEIIADKAFRGLDAITEDNYPVEEMQDSRGNYQRSVTVTEVSQDDLITPQAGSGFKKVDVTVSWGNISQEHVVITTLLTEY